MPDREEIATRHGIPNQAEKLVGETAEQLEADAAARAAIAKMFGSVTPDATPPPEPAVEAEDEGRAPEDRTEQSFVDRLFTTGLAGRKAAEHAAIVRAIHGSADDEQ